VQVRRYSPLPEADLQKLLNSPQFLSAQNAGTVTQSERFWMPMLALLTGARGAELTHLTVNDIRRIAGSWELSLGSPTGPLPWGQRSRNRWIPMSTELIACGFLTFSAQCKLAGKHQLFVSESAHTKPSAQIASVNAWLARLGEKNGVSKATLASLRYNFIVSCIDGGLTVPKIHSMLRGQLRSWVPLFGFSAAERPRISGGSAAESQEPHTAKRFNHLHVADPLFAVNEAYPLSISS
jgi:integrase